MCTFISKNVNHTKKLEGGLPSSPRVLQTPLSSPGTHLNNLPSIPRMGLPWRSLVPSPAHSLV